MGLTSAGSATPVLLVKDIVAGGRVRAHSTAVHAVLDPANGSTVGVVPVADDEDVSSAVEAARAALVDPAWRTTTGAQRGALLHRLADLLESRVGDLAPLLTRENGLAITSSRTSVAKTAAAYRYYGDLAAASVDEQVRPSAGGDAHTVVRTEPIGVAALIVPFNGPQSLLSWKLAPALAAGCTAVVKPALETSLDAYLLLDLVAEAGFPPGVINLVPGDAATGRALIGHPGVDKVAFTGSTAAGIAIGIECARRLVPATLELGGKSAAIVLDDVDVSQFAGWVVGVCSPNTGQVCRSCTRVLVHESVYDQAVEVVASAMAAVPVGDPSREDVVFGPLISHAQLERVEGMVATALAEGAILATGGHRILEETGGSFYAPTVLRDVRPDMRIAQEEVFGPVVVVMSYRDDDHLVALANDSEFGLGGFILTSDLDRGTDIARRVDTGSIGVNIAGLLMEAPFGGFKRSGLGKELGPEGLTAYQRTKSIYRAGAAPA